jgi:hypothetical protein
MNVKPRAHRVARSRERVNVIASEAKQSMRRQGSKTGLLRFARNDEFLPTATDWHDHLPRKSVRRAWTRAPDAAQRAAVAAWCAADPGPMRPRPACGSRLCGASSRDAAPRPGHARSPQMTIFWHCGAPRFSSKTGSETRLRQPTVNGFGRESGSKGSGNADSQRFVRSSGGSGDGRSRPGDSGCVRAHPADWRASASYRPLRAVWAVCAWALRGCARSPEPFSAPKSSARP